MSGTKIELLRAGVHLYGHLRTGLLGGLTSGQVAKTAGFHRQTFYRYWPTQDAYLMDLVRFALDSSDGPTADGVVTLQDEPCDHTDFESFVRKVAFHDFNRFTKEPNTALRVGLLGARANSPEVAALLEEYYERVMSDVAASYDEMLRRWDREPTPPYGSRDIARVMQALVFGMAQSATFGQESVPAAQLYERAAVDILMTMTRAMADVDSP